MTITIVGLGLNDACHLFLYRRQQSAWGGIKNGDLLQRTQAEFDLFITSDRNIRSARKSSSMAV
jgi:hypothetical protein